MADFGVFARSITRIDPIPGADAIELATVGGYQCVIRKGAQAVGEVMLYIPEAAVLPPDVITALGLDGKLSGSAKNRVKTIKLRGQLSQGLLYPLPHVEFLDYEHDFAPELGITKYTPVIPAHFGGSVVGVNSLQLEPWIDIDSVKSMRSFNPETATWNDPFDGRSVVATLKVHGTAFCCTASVEGFYLSSKGMGRAGRALVEAEGNVYWRAAKKFALPETVENTRALFGLDKVSVYGEVYGPGVQDLTYGAAEIDFRAFDVRINGRWLSPKSAELFAFRLGIPFVPVVYAGIYNYEHLVELAEALTGDVGGLVSAVQEGIVLRALDRHPSEAVQSSDRLVGKIVSSRYLLRKNGSEFN